MTVRSTYWLALGYFTYFLLWHLVAVLGGLAERHRPDAEKIGLLLGAGMIARFVGSLLIASRVRDPSQLVLALRLLALLTLLCAVGFWVEQQWLWLLLVMVGFNLFSRRWYRSAMRWPPPDAADRAALRAGQALGLAGVRDRLGAYRHAGNRPEQPGGAVAA